MRSPSSPEDQGVTFVELFFDLAFVFAVTKTVDLFHHGFGWATIGQATIVFWLVWWAWTQFTWTLNAADTKHQIVVASTLASTAIAFFMAVALPDAFRDRALLFAIPYVAIRVIGLALYLWVASANKAQRQPVQTFTLVSVGGLLAVMGGSIVGGQTQLWLWGLAIFLDIIALMVAARSKSWSIHPAHFCERHGLVVIIALGETLIVVAVGMTVLTEITTFLTVGTLHIATSCGMWWLYFARMKHHMDRAMETAEGARRSAMARDVYSLIHFLILGGIIAFAVAVENGFAKGSDPVGTSVRIAAALSVGLYGGGTVLAFLRATGRLLIPRLILTLVTLGAMVIPSITAFTALTVACAAVIIVGVIEHRTLGRVGADESATGAP